MKSLTKTALALAAVGGLLAGAFGTGASARGRQSSAPLEGEGEGLKLIANVEYKGGTDMEFLTIKGRDYAFAASAPGVGGATPEDAGLRVIDVTNPAKPKVVAHLKCGLYQGDVQISHDKKTLMLAADSAGGPESCLAIGKLGFMTIDIRNPKKPKPIGFAEIPRGSHNITAHPTKPFVYNSDADLANAGLGQIQIWSIKNPKKPELVNTVRTGTNSPHDISFNADGTMAVTAGINVIELFDTTDPANPQLMFVTQCPGCSITHDAKFTPDGQHVIVGDEGGGGSPYPCPGGALYFYNVVETPASPVLVPTGIYEPEEVLIAPSGQTGLGACTSHVFDISDDGTKVAISWYTAGTRYLDVSSMQGLTFGGTNTPGGVVELGWFIPENGDSWSSKFHKGPYIYSNDINRGFDVYKIEGG